MVESQDLGKIQFFADCSAAEIRELAALCRRVSYRPGQSIHDENAPVQMVYAVLTGEVLLYRSSGGSRASRLAVVKAGELFGIGEALLPTYYTGASALSACLLLEIGREDFVRRFLAVPAVRERVVRELSRMVRFLICKVTGGGGRHDLALYLRTQAEECGQDADDCHRAHHHHQLGLLELQARAQRHLPLQRRIDEGQALRAEHDTEGFLGRDEQADGGDQRHEGRLRQ